jgi:hypothetical protein
MRIGKMIQTIDNDIFPGYNASIVFLTCPVGLSRGKSLPGHPEKPGDETRTEEG